jgi:hypothetical protein
MFKKLLFLIVAALVYLHFYPEPAVDAWYTKQMTMLKMSFDDATGTGVRLKSDVIYKNLLPELSSFSPKEQLYLKELTLTSRSVKDFYENHCKTGKRNAHFNIKNQQKVCVTISRYAGLLN